MTRDLLDAFRKTNILKSSGKINSNWRKMITPELAIAINLEFDRLQVDSISQLVWCLSNKQSRPKCKTCKKHTRFLSSGKFRTFCSAKCAAVNSDTKAKRTKTCLEFYGVPNVAQSSLFATKQSISARKSFTNKVLKEIGDTFSTDSSLLNSAEKFSFTCSKCSTTAPWRVFKGRVPRCYKCQPHSQSTTHVTVRKFLDDLGVNFVEHDRSIIKPLELDFYLHDFQLAIEVNGVYWHSEENGHAKHEHQVKTIKCLEKGITLIHLFEDEIVLNFDSVKNKLIENYFQAKEMDIIIDGVLEVDGSWPLPQWFSAEVVGVSEPDRYQVSSSFSKQNLTIWDSGKLYYVSKDQQ